MNLKTMERKRLRKFNVQVYSLHTDKMRWQQKRNIETRCVICVQHGVRRSPVHRSSLSIVLIVVKWQIFSLQVACCCKFFGVIKVKYLLNKFWHAIRVKAMCVCVHGTLVFLRLYFAALLFLSVSGKFIAVAWLALGLSLINSLAHGWDSEEMHANFQGIAKCKSRLLCKSREHSVKNQHQ